MAVRKRRRIGRVSLYEHHGGYWLYHTFGGRPIRRLIDDSVAVAECEASLLNAQLVAADAGLLLQNLPPLKTLWASLKPAALPIGQSTVTVAQLVLITDLTSRRCRT
jgi:hypothetical protein